MTPMAHDPDRSRYCTVHFAPGRQLVKILVLFCGIVVQLALPGKSLRQWIQSSDQPELC